MLLLKEALNAVEYFLRLASGLFHFDLLLCIKSILQPADSEGSCSYLVTCRFSADRHRGIFSGAALPGTNSPTHAHLHGFTEQKERNIY